MARSLLTLLLLGSLVSAAARDASLRPLRRRSLSPRVFDAHDLGPAPSTAKRTIVVSLALRSRGSLARFLEDVRDPASPRYRRFMTQDEFVARHAPSESEERALVAYLRKRRFRITYRAPNRLLVGAKGTVGAIERAFGVRIHDLAIDGEERRVALEEPSLPRELAASVVGVLGLGDVEDMRSHVALSGPVDAKSGGARTQCCAFGPPELRRFYDGATGYDGDGQTIAIAGVYAWDINDLTTFSRLFGLPRLARGSAQVCTGASKLSAGCAYSRSGSLEVALDAEYAHATAPRARLLNYMAASPSITDFVVMYNTIVGGGGRRAARSSRGSAGWVVSTSWGVCEADLSAAALTTYDNILVNGNAIGQSWVAASGDRGSRGCHGFTTVDFPASSPQVVAVGGTKPTCSGRAGACDGYGSEQAWSGSGGGASRVFVRGAFQAGCGVPAGWRRLVPDVAIAADPSPGIFMRHGGAWRVVGGTSAGAPQWAGLFAQINQRNGGGGLGHPGPRLYALCDTAAFHDITEGSNGDYSAMPGYDLVTGLGSVDARILLSTY